MPRSSGTYSPPASSWFPTVGAAPATKADWDALLADISAAITQSISSDGQTVPSNPAAVRQSLGSTSVGDAVFLASTATVARAAIGAVALTGTETIAGVKTFSSQPVFPVQSMVRLNTANGHGSTNTKIRRFTTTVTNQGTDITYADSATLGGSFTINVSGVYAIAYSDCFASTSTFGLSLNTSQPTISIAGVTVADVLSVGISSVTDSGIAQFTGYFPIGSVVRPHTNGTSAGTGYTLFTIARVA